MKPYAAGVDIGGTTIKMGLFTTEGGLLEKWEIPTAKENAGGWILPDAAASLFAVLKRFGIPLSSLEGVGMGVPGAVLADGTVNRCVNLGWDVFPAAERFSSLLEGVPVKVGNDADVAALGEMWKGGGKGCRSLVMVTLGTGESLGSLLSDATGNSVAKAVVDGIPTDPTVFWMMSGFILFMVCALECIVIYLAFYSEVSQCGCGRESR